MQTGVLRALSHCETDVDSALRRFCGNEDLYIAFLNEFVHEPTMHQLTLAVEKGNWDEAFISAHALKGLAGNLGFIPLFHSIGELVVAIRSGKEDSIITSFKQTRLCYDEVVFAINTSEIYQ